MRIRLNKNTFNVISESKEDLIKNIKELLINKSNNISSLRISSKYFIDSLLEHDIIKETSNLSKQNSDISTRIKFILSNYTQIPICQFCNKQIKLFKCETCGDNKCSQLLRLSKCNKDVQKNNSVQILKQNLIHQFKNSNYQLLSRNDVVSFIKTKTSNRSLYHEIHKHDYISNSDILCSIIFYTNFLLLDSKINWAERKYCLINDIFELNVCNKCNKNTTKFNSIKNGYNNECISCAKESNGIFLKKHAIEIAKSGISDEYEILTEYSDSYKSFSVNKFYIHHKKCKNNFYIRLSNGKWKHDSTLCPICYPGSKIEHEIVKFLTEMNIEIIQNDRSELYPLELDIYSPKDQIAIEINGNYWHSSFNEGDNRTDKLYHINKTNLCANKGIRLIHIFEDEWRTKQDIVKNRLRSIFKNNQNKIYARKCKISEIDSKTKSKFLEKYHIQGNDNSSIKLGLFYDTELIAVMTFGKCRFKSNSIELIRYATIENCTVLGGAGKLLKYFERNYTPKILVSYADLRWSNGNLYYKLNFDLLKTSPPDFWYVHKNSIYIRESRMKFQKHKLPKVLDIFDPGLSSAENIKDNGYAIIYGCGNLVFERHY